MPYAPLLAQAPAATAQQQQLTQQCPLLCRTRRASQPCPSPLPPWRPQLRRAPPAAVGPGQRGTSRPGPSCRLRCRCAILLACQPCLAVPPVQAKAPELLRQRWLRVCPPCAACRRCRQRPRRRCSSCVAGCPPRPAASAAAPPAAAAAAPAYPPALPQSQVRLQAWARPAAAPLPLRPLLARLLRRRPRQRQGAPSSSFHTSRTCAPLPAGSKGGKGGGGSGGGGGPAW